jgi:hypothetical protein
VIQLSRYRDLVIKMLGISVEDVVALWYRCGGDDLLEKMWWLRDKHVVAPW